MFASRGSRPSAAHICLDSSPRLRGRRAVDSRPGALAVRAAHRSETGAYTLLVAGGFSIPGLLLGSGTTSGWCGVYVFPTFPVETTQHVFTRMPYTP
eukprot:4542358-Pyramimonas_sp.AAC.1